MALDNGLTYGKTHPRALTLGCVQTLEWPQDALQVGGVDAGAVIPNGKKPLFVLFLRSDVNAERTPSTVTQRIEDQVLENLLWNALKYTPEGTPIEIGAEASVKGTEVWVADRGPGIAPGQEQTVFEKFNRGNLEAAQSGVGLGLSICRAIVTAHGGKISAANRAGGGAIFRFALPATGSPPDVGE